MTGGRANPSVSRYQQFGVRLLGLCLLLTPPVYGQRIWITHAEIMARPTSGEAWNRMKAAADQSTANPDLSNQDDNTNVYVLAAALVYARTGDAKYKTKVVAACGKVIGTENGARTLALGRELAAYIVAADLVSLPDAGRFNAWLDTIPDKRMSDGKSLVQCMEQRPNNWGTMAMGSLAALAVYRNNQALLDHVAECYLGYIGNRHKGWTKFIYGDDLSWQFEPNEPVGINHRGATKNGLNIDGIMPDDMRRMGPFRNPPLANQSYPWEGLQGAAVCAEILSRTPDHKRAWEQQYDAIYRAVSALYRVNSPATGDDLWTVWLVNRAYKDEGYRLFPTSNSAYHGKNMGWTSWSHAN